MRSVAFAAPVGFFASRWTRTDPLHWGGDSPRPFFYPLVGPSGSSVTRIGHPGAPDHDHHRSVWFAHMKVLGMDFWAEPRPFHQQIRQRHWLAYEADDTAARIAVDLDWSDGHEPQPLLTQQLIAAAQPLEHRPGFHAGEWALEIQATFTPTADQLTFEQTNFGFLAVRVAQSISARFGGGQLTNSAGLQGEAALFGQAAQWVDYTGPNRKIHSQEVQIEGITYIDHPENPGQPTHWHVRDDGWMGASVCMKSSLTIRKKEPTTVRYLLFIHAGLPESSRINALAEEFGQRPRFQVIKPVPRLSHWSIVRQST